MRYFSLKTFFLVFYVFHLNISAQGVGINNSGLSPDPSAGLDVSYNDKGILIPRLTSAERNGIVLPASGLMILNVDNFCLEMWDGSSWRSACFDCGFNGQIYGTTQVCVGDSLLLYVNLFPGSQAVWTLPGGQTVTGDSLVVPSANLSHTGAYQVQVTAPGCIVSPAQVSVQVSALPSGLNPSVNSPVVVGSQIQLQASLISGASYIWTGPGGFSSTQQNPVVNNAQVTMSGYYVVRAQSGACTSAPDSVLVNVVQQVFQTFTQSGTFVVPQGVSQVRVLCVGGGGGGGNGHSGGGGSGFVATGTFSVSQGQSIAVTVGQAGNGAIQQTDNSVVGISPGGSSSFGNLLSAGGGQVVTSSGSTANSGGSGGGGSCNGGTTGGNGGTGGSNGGSCTYSGGAGQGNYVPALSLFVHSSVSAGSGGLGGSSSHAGGGGGGGVLIGGAGPVGADGPQSWSGKGGNGYGGGGGAGGYSSSSNIRHAGGNGAPGVVYVEWL
jgi:hypothetical protein